MKFRTIKSIK